MKYNQVSSFLERNAREGDSPVYEFCVCILKARLGRVELLGSAAQIGWYTSSKAKYRRETDSEQVP